MTNRGFRARVFTTTLIATLILSGCAPVERDQSPVGVQLFMYNWVSVAKQCEEVLGPAGINYAFISPAQEHITGEPWWIQYQPTSYEIESRLGTREEFVQMVKTCKESGVGIIADAVINHMSASDSGEGWNGTTYSKYEYPNLYERPDFHDCQLTDNNQIQDYTNASQVQTCELLGLSDLKTEVQEVQQTIANYLLDLLEIGVVGFRIDAAKHISSKDLNSIVELLPEETLIFQEVIKGEGEPIQPEDYLASGSLWEFSYARQLSDMFAYEAIEEMGETYWHEDFLPSDSALSFVTNHDTERNGQTLNTYSNPMEFELATAMMLADPYGMPILYGGYAFENYDDAPALGEDGRVLDAVCEKEQKAGADYVPGSWPCQYRFESTLGMIAFRKAVGGNPQTDILSAPGVVGWGRGSAGYFAVNISPETYSKAFRTKLEPGIYCDSITGGAKPIKSGKCIGLEIVVQESGSIEHELESWSAFAIHRESRLG
jgi:alpha-amylase